MDTYELVDQLQMTEVFTCRSGEAHETEYLPLDLSPKIANDICSLISGTPEKQSYIEDGTYRILHDDYLIPAIFQLPVEDSDQPMFIFGSLRPSYLQGTEILSDYFCGYLGSNRYESDTDRRIPVQASQLPIMAAFEAICETAETGRNGVLMESSTEFHIGQRIVDILWARNPYASLVKPSDVKNWSIHTTIEGEEHSLIISQHASIEGVGDCVFRTIRTYKEDGKIIESYIVRPEEDNGWTDIKEVLTPHQHMEVAISFLERRFLEQEFSMTLESAGATHIGGRETNEDAFISVEGDFRSIGWYAIADGMGGHASGEEASRTAIDITTIEMAKQLMEFGYRNRFPNWSDIEFMLDQSIRVAREEIQQAPDNRDTTLSVLFVLQGQGHIAHIGDSRIYAIQNEQTLIQVTNDHNEYGKQTRLGNQGAWWEKSFVLNSLAVAENFTIDFRHIYLNDIVGLLLATDGLYDCVGSDGIMQGFEASQKQSLTVEQGKAFIQPAVLAKSSDNITGIVVRHGK